MTDFEQFVKYFKEYQHRFGLTGYRVYFKHEPLEDCFASISISEMVATVKLNIKLPEKNKVYKDIKRSAKHEALHLLLHRIEYQAENRYATEEEIYNAVEELVFKLEELIKEEV